MKTLPEVLHFWKSLVSSVRNCRGKRSVCGWAATGAPGSAPRPAQLLCPPWGQHGERGHLSSSCRTPSPSGSDSQHGLWPPRPSRASPSPRQSPGHRDGRSPPTQRLPRYRGRRRRRALRGPPLSLFPSLRPTPRGGTRGSFPPRSRRAAAPHLLALQQHHPAPSGRAACARAPRGAPRQRRGLGGLGAAPPGAITPARARPRARPAPPGPSPAQRHSTSPEPGPEPSPAIPAAPPARGAWRPRSQPACRSQASPGTGLWPPVRTAVKGGIWD